MRTPRGGRPAARLLFSLLALALLGVVPARAVAPNFTVIAPTGGQRGTSVELTLRGERLADAAEILFYDDGLKADKILSATDKEVKVLVRISPECPLGEHALRLRTASGLSALRIFYVGPFPSVEEKEPNNSIAEARPVALNTTIEGTIGNEDVDYFTVQATQGQRLSLEIEGARLARTMFDPFIAIQEAGGRILASSDDTPLLGHDGFVSIVVPAAGRYVIQVRDTAYSGNGHFYRLHVGSFPRPAVVFPLGGKAGDTLEARFIGDPAGEFLQQIKLPPEISAKFGAQAVHDGAAPSPNWMRVSALPNAANVKTGATAATAPLLNLPAPLAFNGVLELKGESGFFRFNARKNQNLDVTVYARRLGSPLDSVLTVLDAKGKTLGSNDDAAGNPDSTVRVKMAEDGIYTVKVADQLNRGGPTYAYRVEIAEVRPVLVLSIPDTARYDYETRKSVVVPRGNRFAVLLNIARDGCNDDLAVALDGLPAGMTLAADTVPGSLSAVPVVFEAGAEAPLAGKMLTPRARPTDAAKAAGVGSRFRHTIDWVRIQNDTMYVRSEVEQIAAAVVDAVPFKVSIKESKAPIVQGGDKALEIIAERQEGFDEPITVKMLWNPPGISALPDMVIPKGANHVAYQLNATARADVRKWKTAAVASATVKGGTAYVSTQLADLEVAAPHLAGKIELTKVERGLTAKMVCVLDQKSPFDGTAVAKLVGLPGNVTANPVEITKDSKEAVFEVVTTDKSPTGSHKSVFCNVVVMRDGEPVSHLIAQGSVLRIDPPRGKPVAVAGSPALDTQKAH